MCFFANPASTFASGLMERCWREVKTLNTR
jgi:hypothetical protein